MADLPENPIEIWASQDYVLPNTGQRNKKRPIDDLWLKGYDKGQKPSVEHFNYLFNLLTDWVAYLRDLTGGLDGKYLPLNGTTLVMGGDVTGTAMWAGDKTTNVGIQVVDNSHNHVSSNITDATSESIANKIVIRNNTGGVHFSGLTTKPKVNGEESFLYLLDINDVKRGGVAFNSTENRVTIWTQNPDGSSSSGIDIFNSYINMVRPRTNNPQEGVGNALVRFDYLSENLNSINTRIDNIQQVVTQGVVSGVRLGVFSRTGGWDGDVYAKDGQVFVMIGDFGANDGYGGTRPLEYEIDGVWRMVGVVGAHPSGRD